LHTRETDAGHRFQVDVIEADTGADDTRHFGILAITASAISAMRRDAIRRRSAAARY
jgi:hypothetical protein